MDCDGCDTRKRSMDRRRETSRCAARERRGKESDVFSDLRDVVPLVEDSTVGHLDRIALLRVAATVCRFRSEAASVLDTLEVSNQTGKPVDVHTEETLTEALDGFIIICNVDGDVLYITESVALYLGLTQTDIAGRGLKEFFHTDDFNEFREIVAGLVSRYVDESSGRTVVFRMKTVISPRGRNLNMKSALYKPVSFVIRCRKSDAGANVIMMQGVCVPAGQGSVNANATALTKGNDTPSGAYMTRHTCDMRISFISERLNYILKNDLKSLVGASFYDLVHPADCEIISKAMKELFSKGHVRTPYYRLLAANGTLAWIMTEANTTSHTCKGQKGQYVVCVHFIIGIQDACEPLVLCTDSAPAGLPVEIKKEIDDTDYTGRQPECIDQDNYVPLFTDDNFVLAESIRHSEGDTASGVPRQEGYDEVLDWLFRDKPSSPGAQQRQQQCRPSDDPTLASAQLVAPPTCSRCEDPYAYSSPLIGGGPQLSGRGAGSLDQCRESYTSAAAREASYGSFTRGGSVASSTATSTPPCVSAVHSPDNNAVPTGDSRGASAMYAVMPAANPSLAAACPVMNEQPFNNAIVEDLQWEEPDLTGLAPFVPDDDVIDFGASEGIPKDLEMLFNSGEMPQWTAATPLVPIGPPPMMTRVKYEPAAFVPSYLAQTPQDLSMGVNDLYQRQQNQQNNTSRQQEQYWQPSVTNWSSPPNNYNY